MSRPLLNGTVFWNVMQRVALKCCLISFELYSFKYFGVVLNEDNNKKIDLQERINNAYKTYFMLQNFL